jgi:hypothetical protein
VSPAVYSQTVYQTDEPGGFTVPRLNKLVTMLPAIQAGLVDRGIVKLPNDCVPAADVRKRNEYAVVVLKRAIADRTRLARNE